jgi:hypothetical protein
VWSGAAPHQSHHIPIISIRSNGHWPRPSRKVESRQPHRLERVCVADFDSSHITYSRATIGQEQSHRLMWCWAKTSSNELRSNDGRPNGSKSGFWVGHTRTMSHNGRDLIDLCGVTSQQRSLDVFPAQLMQSNHSVAFLSACRCCSPLPPASHQPMLVH